MCVGQIAWLLHGPAIPSWYGPPATANNLVIFGKNSDRPSGEVQEMCMVEAKDYEAGTKLKCTHIEIDQAGHTQAVILSKPAWCWGAEMGANEHGVCIGNEAVYTKIEDDGTTGLIGMDLVRLGLERATSAQEALDVMTSLLESHGQEGSCGESPSSLKYHNSYLIVDHQEAWVLETAGRLWAAEKVTSAYRHISNCLSISTTIDKSSSGLKEEAQARGFWNPDDGDFNFAEAFGNPSEDATQRCNAAVEIYKGLNGGNDGSFTPLDMMKILRDRESNICRSVDHSFPTAASQVSVLGPAPRPPCHWFTATPDPSRSVFKPFVFAPGCRLSPHVVSQDNPQWVGGAQDRSHLLYRQHAKQLTKGVGDWEAELSRLEAQCLEEVEAFLTGEAPDLAEVADLFRDAVDTELRFYK
ncbi:SCRN2 [Cordylochernes scorpioides]|uniref:SCRN2 n=1 Tax=Cordylochernes scorpioides TaxID=51811 RepID=A0ABY6JY65_9ARAC|nr:SCRN2 [Cordylochernes scorpioides]